MTTAFVASGLLGIALGMRFSVYSLVPISLLAIVITGAASFLMGFGALTVIAAVMTTTITVQIGYVCGSFAACFKEQPTVLQPSAVAHPSRTGFLTK